MNYTEFESKILKRSEKKNYRVTNSWGAYDIYKHIRRNKWFNIGRPIKEKEFYDVTSRVNGYLAEELKKGNTVVFPHKMGKLELRRIPKGIYIVDGKIKNTYPIDWNATLKLWYEDSEERDKKTLVRREQKEAFEVKYDKYRTNYTNKSFYEFCLNRFIKLALKENINKGLIDTLW